METIPFPYACLYDYVAPGLHCLCLCLCLILCRSVIQGLSVMYGYSPEHPKMHILNYYILLGKGDIVPQKGELKTPKL